MIQKKSSLVAKESPDFARISFAAALTLGFARGRFWRDAKLKCVNLLLTYQDGCAADCAYCGLNRQRQGEQSFIHVQWPCYALEEIIASLVKRRNEVERVCVAMVTHRRALVDIAEIATRIRAATDIPISALISPTIVNRDGLIALREAGVDRLGIAIDAATPQIFARLRKSHDWETYWRRFEEGVNIFGERKVGSHFIVGLDETEQEMVSALQRVRDLGGVNHLFSFYPENGTRLQNKLSPPIAQYRRIQLAAHLIDSGLARAEQFVFSPNTGKILRFGVPAETLDNIIERGDAFMTRGCLGCDGRVACNRPFANSLPGEEIRNFPFAPEPGDIERIRCQVNGKQSSEKTDFLRHKPTAKLRPKAGGEMLFFAPSLKRYDTEEFRNSTRPTFVPVSVTGEECQLNCTHCGSRLLKGMREARTPDALWDLASRLREQGGKGLLLTGGCDVSGVVPLGPFCETLAQIKSALGMRTTVHVRLVDAPLARSLAKGRVDAVMIDVVGSDTALREVHRLTNHSLSDIARSLDLLEQCRLPLAPHIVLGLGDRQLTDEFRALEMLDGRRLSALVIVINTPLNSQTAQSYREPDSDRVHDLFVAAREAFCDVPLLLGCARPPGALQQKVETAALEAQFDGIAYPADNTVRQACEMGLRTRFSEYCCALMI